MQLTFAGFISCPQNRTAGTGVAGAAVFLSQKKIPHPVSAAQLCRPRKHVTRLVRAARDSNDLSNMAAAGETPDQKQLRLKMGVANRYRLCAVLLRS